MVSSMSILAMVVTLLCTLVLPFVVCIVYTVKKRTYKVGVTVLLGAAGFFVMQMVIRTSILNIVSLNPSFVAFSKNNFVLYCLLLAFTAGLSEVIARYAVAKIISKKLCFEQGVAAGLGHGCIEAVLLVGVTYINNLLYSLMINMGSFDAAVAQTAAMGADTTALLGVKEALISTSPVLFLAAGYERILTVLLHVALTVLVCYFVAKKKDIAGIGLCLLIHTAVDFAAPFISGLATETMGNKIGTTTAYSIVYVFLTVVGAASVVAIRKVKKCWK